MITTTQKVDFISSTFGKAKLDSTAENIAVSCPKCDEKSEKLKLSINITTWQVHCWVCGLKSKNLYYILKKYISKDSASSFKKKFNLQISDQSSQEKDDEVIEKTCLPEGFCLLGENIKSRDPDIRSCISYLKSRGLSESDMWRFCLGTARTGTYRRRIIFPSFDLDGELNYFVARSIDKDSKRKYVNARSKKSEIIFNEYLIDFKSELVIVEGPFDLVKSTKNSVCILGSSISKNSYLFKRIVHNQTPVVIALDYDMREKTQKIARLLSDYGCNVRIAKIPEDSDIGDMSKIQAQEIIGESSLWSRNIGLLEKIKSIKSGSII